MRAFLCGGGSGKQVEDAYKKFAELINKSKPLLYIPLAMESEKYDECYAWICNELQEYGISNIYMVMDCSELYDVNIDDYAAVFIGGGSTYKLLFELKMTGFFDKLIEYIKSNGIVFGGSAGAIIMGYDIKSCDCDEKNMVGLVDTKGLNILNGMSLLCHFSDRTDEKIAFNRAYLKELSITMKVLALSECHTIYIGDDGVEFIGKKPFSVFSNGEEIIKA